MPNPSLVTFNDWVRWLETRHMMPAIAPGIERMERALEKANLKHKNDRARTIHIAGTNGKGTTAKALEHLIHHAGESVGLFTSPHLVSTCERISVNKELISEEDFIQLCQKHYDTICEIHLTHFESLTLIAFDYFLTVKKTKWMIFEIGLGGTWDSTNAIDHATSVITTLGMDHMHILGNTLEDIAGNKFGIIKANNTVIHQRYPKSIETLLHSKLQATSSTGIGVEPLPYSCTEGLVPNYVLHYDSWRIPLQLPGERAVQNMSTAITAFLALGFSKDHIPSLSTLQWPARMTPLPVPNAPCPVYISGDHNEQGIASLCELLQHSTYDRLTVILGLSKNRSHDVFVENLNTLRDLTIIFTAPRFQGVLPDPQKHSPYFESAAAAVAASLRDKKPNDLVVVTGSLYLCGELLAQYKS